VCIYIYNERDRHNFFFHITMSYKNLTKEQSFSLTLTLVVIYIYT